MMVEVSEAVFALKPDGWGIFEWAWFGPFFLFAAAAVIGWVIAIVTALIMVLRKEDR